MKLQVNGRDAYANTGNRELDPTKESVVFVHGAGQDHSIWVLPARHFARKGRNVLSVDLPGHGRSDGPPLTSIEAMATWITELMTEAGVERASIVGHSMGSLVALAAAAMHPDRTRSIALVGTAVPMPVSDGLLNSAAENDHAAVEMLTYWGHSSSAHLGGNATPGMWMIGSGMRLMERAGEGVIHADLNACNHYVQGGEHASMVHCPAMLILGQRDIMTPVRATKPLTEAIANVETVVFPDAGHALLSERPDPVLDALIRIV